MESDRDHGRRWRRSPFAPASFAQPSGGAGRGGDGVPEPREPRPDGGGASEAADADAERSPDGR